MTDTKYMLVDLNEKRKPYCGLFNQLWALTNAIIIGDTMGRDIIVSGFFKNFNSVEVIDLFEIIDKSQLYDLFAQLNINIKVWTVKDNVTSLDDFHRISLQKIKGYMRYRNKLGENKIYSGCTFYLDYRNPRHIYHKKSYSLLSGYRFHSHIIEAVNNYIQQLQLDDYSAVHLRIEDDFITTFSMRKGMKPRQFSDLIFKKYCEKISLLLDKNKKIYIATSLIKTPNKNNGYIHQLKELYPNIVYRSQRHIWSENSVYYGSREVEAIIDYLICRKASKFIGCYYSTFSHFLVGQLEQEMKTCFLVE